MVGEARFASATCDVLLRSGLTSLHVCAAGAMTFLRSERSYDGCVALGHAGLTHAASAGAVRDFLWCGILP
jgi:hypothetical protein